MSQIYKSTVSGPPPPGTVLFLEGNDLVAVGPNAAGIIFVPGNGVLTSGVSTAGNLVSTNTAPNTLTVSPTQAQFMTNYTASAAATYNVTATDHFISLDPTAAPITVNLPATPGTNRLFIIKDRTGQAAVNNITIVPSSGTIDGRANIVMNSNFQALQLLFNGTNYEVY